MKRHSYSRNAGRKQIVKRDSATGDGEAASSHRPSKFLIRDWRRSDESARRNRRQAAVPHFLGGLHCKIRSRTPAKSDQDRIRQLAPRNGLSRHHVLRTKKQRTIFVLLIWK